MLKKSPKIKSQSDIHFRVYPRDLMTKDILLPSQTIHALNKAAETLKNVSNDQYELVLTRGYVYWGRLRRFRGALAKIIFYLLYWADRTDTELLFGHNGHNDGLSVDVQLYDLRLNKIVHFLSWKNIIIPRAQAKKTMATNKAIIDMLDTAMTSANFIAHTDPREKLQMHYRLNITGENLQLMSVVA